MASGSSDVSGRPRTKAEKRRTDSKANNEHSSHRATHKRGSVFAKPKRLIYTNTENKLDIDQNTLQELVGIDGKELVVVAITGLYRTGKSYLMNRLAGQKAGFALGATIKSKTKGIWIWIREHPKGDGRYLVLLDTEGLGDVTKGDSNHDCQIFCLATLLSSVLVYNVMKTINDQGLEKLHVIAEFSKHIRTHEGSDNTEIDEDFDFYFPQFICAIRDFDLVLEKDNRELTADEYLEDSLTLREGDDDHTKMYNFPRRCIRNYFKERKCFTFDVPAGRKKMPYLDTISDTEISTDFLQESKLFCAYVFENGSVKTTQTGQCVDMKMWSSMLENFVRSIRQGNIPCIESSVKMMAKAHNEKSIDKALDVYKKEIELATQTRHDSTTFNSAHSKARSEALACFMENVFSDNEYEFRKRFEDKIQQEFEHFQESCAKESLSKCKQSLLMLNKEITEKNKMGGYSKSGGYIQYTEDVNTVKEKFNTNMELDLKAREVLEEYLDEMDKQGQGILATDKRISEEQKNAERAHEAAAASDRRRKMAEERQEEIEHAMNERHKKHMQEVVKLNEKTAKEKSHIIDQSEKIQKRRLEEQKKQLYDQYKGLYEKQAKEVEERRRKVQTPSADQGREIKRREDYTSIPEKPGQLMKEKVGLLTGKTISEFKAHVKSIASADGCSRLSQEQIDTTQKKNQSQEEKRQEDFKASVLMMEIGQSVKDPKKANDWISQHADCKGRNHIARGAVVRGDVILFKECVHIESKLGRNNHAFRFENNNKSKVTAVVAIDCREHGKGGTLELSGDIPGDGEVEVKVKGKIFKSINYRVVMYGPQTYNKTISKF